MTNINCIRPGCETPEVIPGARFCIACGYALRQPCPVCAAQTLVGGGELDDGRCAHCATPLRVCATEGCGRIHNATARVCECSNRSALEPLPLRWSTPTGPENGTRSFAVPALPSVKYGNVQVWRRGFLALDLGRTIALVDEATVQRIGSESSRAATNHDVVSNPAPIAIAGDLYLATTNGVERIPLAGRQSEVVTDQRVVTHTVGPDGWVGAAFSGEILDRNGNVISTLPKADVGVAVADHNAVYLLYGCNLVRIDMGRVGEPTHSELSSIFLHRGDLYGVRRVGDTTSIVSALPKAQPWASLPARGVGDVDTFVDEVDESVWLLPRRENESIWQVRLSDGSAAQHGWRHPNGRILAIAGLSTPNGLCVLTAVQGDGRPRVLLADPRNGSETELNLPKNALAAPWETANLVIRRQSVEVFAFMRDQTIHVSYDIVDN